VTQNTTVTTLENTAYVFKLADFPFSDPNDLPANTLQSVIVASLPGVGTLTLGRPGGNGRADDRAKRHRGRQVAVRAGDERGRCGPYASFGFALQDNGGTVNGGLDISATASMTVAVTPINHAPVTQNATVTTFENAAYVFNGSGLPVLRPRTTNWRIRCRT